jgi:hypothetical protein
MLYWFRKKRQAPDEEAERIRKICTDLDALEGSEREGVARTMALIWSDLNHRLGGADAFAEADESKRAGYLENLANVACSMSERPTTHSYSLGATAMLIYLRCLTKAAPSEAEAELSQRAAALINLGAALRPATRKPASSAARPDSGVTMPAGSSGASRR